MATIWDWIRDMIEADDLDAISHGFFRFLGRRFTSGSGHGLAQDALGIFLRLAQLLREFVVALLLQQSDGVAEKLDHFQSEFDQFDRVFLLRTAEPWSHSNHDGT
jgi:hypothetical protein